MVHTIFVILFSAGITQNSWGKSYQFQELFSLLEESNLDIKIAQESQKLAVAQREESKSTIYPSVRMEASFVEVEKRSSFGTSSGDRTLENVRLVGQQRLFRGFGEYYELDRLEYLKNMQNRRLESARREVHRVIIDMSSEVWWQKSRLKRQLELVNLSEEREKTIRQRVRVGRSRSSEHLNALSQFASAKAQLSQIKQSLFTALLNLRNVTLIEDLTDLEEPNVESLIENPTLKTNELKLEELAVHPSLLAFDQQILSNEQEIKINNAYHFPQIDFRANYYGKRADVSFEGSDWDIGLFITWPLFEGNIVSARKQQVYARRNQAILQKKQQQIILEQTSSRESNSFVNATQALLDSQKSAELQKNSYHYIKKEYLQGLANQLEVNQSMNIYIQNLLFVDEARIQVIRSYYQFHAMRGKLP